MPPKSIAERPRPRWPWRNKRRAATIKAKRISRNQPYTAIIAQVIHIIGIILVYPRCSDIAALKQFTRVTFYTMLRIKCCRMARPTTLSKRTPIAPTKSTSRLFFNQFPKENDSGFGLWVTNS